MSFVRVLALIAATLATPAVAHAQAYPSKPIRVIVSTSPGGVTDLTARIFGQFVTDKTGQAVVIDNRPGASGNIALDALAKASPDGYTIGVANTGNIVINPHLFRTMSYDPLTDLVPVAPFGTVPLFLVVNGKVPAKNLKEFIAYAKAEPAKVSYAAAGAGTTPDLAALEFGRRAGLKLVMVPFRGTGPATTAVIAGDVQVTFVSMGPHIEFVRNGTLRVLGAATPKRVPYLPDVPTFAEQDFSNFEASTWFAVFAPRGTPPEIVNQLNTYVRDMLQDQDARGRLDANFVEPLSMGAPDFAALVKADAERWERIVGESGIKLD